MTAMTWDRPPVTHWDHFIEDRVPHVFSISIDGGTPSAITLGIGTVARPARDRARIPTTSRPTAQEVAFAANSDESGIDENNDVYVVAATRRRGAQRHRRQSRGRRRAEYSPDGRYLAYTKQTIKGFYGDTQQLWLIDRKSDARRRSPRTGIARSSGIAWSPDSKQLLRLGRRCRHGRIYRFDVAKGRNKP